MPSADWTAPTATGPVDARVVLPGSKSLTNRYLVLAALASDVSLLRSPLRSRDTLLMVQALRTLGAAVDDVDDGDWLVTPGRLVGGGTVDCGLAGNVMRFVPAVAGLADGPVRFDGDPRARLRPMAPVLDALRTLGVEVDDDDRGGLPFTVHGRGSVRGGAVTLDASASSQFVSGLLLSGARFDEGVTVHHDGKTVPSLPHIDMTVEMLRDAGVVVDDGDEHTWRVEPGEVRALDGPSSPTCPTPPVPRRGAGHRRPGPRAGVAADTTQGGDFIRDVLAMMGAEVVLDRAGLTVSGGGSISGIDVDLHDASELTPVVAALCALADSPEHHPRGRPHPRPRDRPARRAAHRDDRARRRRRRDRRRPADPPRPAARRHLPHLRRPPHGHGGRGARAGGARAWSSRTSAPSPRPCPSSPAVDRMLGDHVVAGA